MMPIRPVRSALLRFDIAHPRPESPYRLRHADTPPPVRWQVVPDTGADADDPQFGGW